MAKAATDQSQLSAKLATKAGVENKPVTVKGLLSAPNIKKKFEEVLDKKAPQFMTSITNLVNSDINLQKVDQMSVISSCMVAATLDLPVDKNLGYAWVVPYSGRAQFQMGYKGYIQLALRTGQYRYINAIPVYEGELVSWNRLTEELKLDETKRISDQIIGYCGYFELINGFRKTVYWTKEDIEIHRKRFSKSGFGWTNNYDAMALKTVIRNMLSKWGILSIEMQTAYSKEFDTKVEHGEEDNEDYIDAEFSVMDEGHDEEHGSLFPSDEELGVTNND